MEWRSLPPLSALRAFAAFAEGRSVVAAGVRLGVSHAAISQQLRALEAHLGLVLFDRSARAMLFTPEGQRLADAVIAGFEGMARVISQLTAAEEERPLRITTTASFAAGWLMPRLGDFRQKHPGISLMIDPSPEVQALAPGGIDVALRYGRGDWPGVVATVVVPSRVVVVASPKLVGAGPIQSVEELADYPWLQEIGTNEATRYLERNGVTKGIRRGLISLPGNLMIDAARDGQGVATLARAFIEADIAAGRLRVLFADDEREGYFLVTPEGVLRPAAKAFAQWVVRQAATGSGAGY